MAFVVTLAGGGRHLPDFERAITAAAEKGRAESVCYWKQDIPAACRLACRRHGLLQCNAGRKKNDQSVTC